MFISFYRNTSSDTRTELTTVTKAEGMLEFDLKGIPRSRDNHLDQIMGELSIGTDENVGKNSTQNDDDDLLALMDQAQ